MERSTNRRWRRSLSNAIAGFLRVSSVLLAIALALVAIAHHRINAWASAEYSIHRAIDAINRKSEEDHRQIELRIEGPLFWLFYENHRSRDQFSLREGPGTDWNTTLL